jgi:hypothetical protein
MQETPGLFTYDELGEKICFFFLLHIHAITGLFLLAVLTKCDGG